MRTLLAVLLLPALTACSEDVLTGAHAEFQALLTFPSGASEMEQTVDVRVRPEVAQIQRGCGQLVLAQSSVSVVGHKGGADGDPFTLAATIIDGTEEIPLLAWSGTLEQGGRLTSFDRAESGYIAAAAAALAPILLRPDPTYVVRYRYTSSSASTETQLRVVQYLEFAVDAAECSGR